MSLCGTRKVRSRPFVDGGTEIETRCVSQPVSACARNSSPVAWTPTPDHTPLMWARQLRVFLRVHLGCCVASACGRRRASRRPTWNTVASLQSEQKKKVCAELEPRQETSEGANAGSGPAEPRSGC